MVEASIDEMLKAPLLEAGRLRGIILRGTRSYTFMVYYRTGTRAPYYREDTITAPPALLDMDSKYNLVIRNGV